MTRSCLMMNNVYSFMVILPPVILLGCSQSSITPPQNVHAPSSLMPKQVVELKVRKLLSDDIVHEWQNAGATAGWMETSEFDCTCVYFSDMTTGARQDGVPGFRFERWPQPEVVAKLPAPDSAFGLSLKSTISDMEVKELTRLKNLHTLDLRRAKVTDRGLKELASLSNLQVLSLQLTQVTDSGLKELASLKDLRILDLGCTEITDVGLKELAALKHLQILDVGCTQITDVGLKELAGLKNLRRLSLFSCKQLTGRGLNVLAGFKDLQMLNLNGKDFPTEALAELKKALPGCRILE